MIADQPPGEACLTEYDRLNAKLYLRLLDAEADDAGWEDAAKRLLDSDPSTDPERARLRYDSHLARAKWLRDGGYVALLQQPD